MGPSLVGAQAGASVTSCVTWGVQPRNVGSENNGLSGVDVVSPCRAWAVGSYVQSGGAAYHPLIEQWTGARWTVKVAPSLGGDNGSLEDVAAVSTSGAWAVGARQDGINPKRTLILHWNGSTWTVQPSPSVGTSTNYLFAVAAVSAGSAWAVGSRFVGTGDRTLILHWNGTEWKVQPSPNEGTLSNDLFDVTALSATNAWAVGQRSDGTHVRALVLHWNGKAWKVQPNPGSGISGNNDVLQGVVATSPTNAWAVGYTYGSSPPTESLILHWNGTAWKPQAHPTAGPGDNGFNDVAATSPTNAWAVGSRDNGLNRTLILHWNGTAWKGQPTPNPGTSAEEDTLVGVAASSSSDAWAVGSHGDVVDRTLAIHCC